MLAGACSHGSRSEPVDARGDGATDGKGNPADELMCTDILYPIETGDAGTEEAGAKYRQSEVLILFDNSESTSFTFGAGTRSSVMADAVSGLVDAYQNRIAFGLMLFPDVASCASGGSPVCCVGSPAVEMGLGKGTAIRTALANRPSPQGGSPMAQALRTALEIFQQRPDQGGTRMVLLATDGRPGCGGVDASVSGGPCREASLAVQALANMPIPVRTLVLSPAPGAPEDCLQDLAKAAAPKSGRDGGADRNGFTADDVASLAVTLESTFLLAPTAEPSCEVVLSPPPVAKARYNVLVDGQAIPYDKFNGWDFQDPSVSDADGGLMWSPDGGQHPDGGVAPVTVSLRGEYCKRLRQFRYIRVEVKYDCTRIY
jgi:hypothetical protein